MKNIGGTISFQSNSTILTRTYLYITGILWYFKQVLKAGFIFGGSVKLRKLKSEGSPLILESYCWLKMNNMLLYYKWLVRFAVITRDSGKHPDLRIIPLTFTLCGFSFLYTGRLKNWKIFCDLQKPAKELNTSL